MTADPSFTTFILTIRYIFFVFSIFTCTLYWSRLRRLDKEFWVIEQKFIGVLGILLCFFDDPFYAITILKPSLTMAFFSGLFMINFIVYLFLFWLVMLQRIVKENGIKICKTVSRQKVIYSSVLWLFLLLTYVGFAQLYLSDPNAKFYDEFGTFYQICKVVGIILASFEICYLFYYYIKFCLVEKTRIWRYKMFAYFSLYFFFMMSILLYFGSFNVYIKSGKQVLMLIVMCNIYIFYLQYLFIPTRKGL